MALGITRRGKGIEHDSYVFNKLYNRRSKGIPELNSAKKEFSYSIQPVIVEDNDFIIIASMGTAEKAEAKVHVVPKRKEDCANPAIQRQLFG